MKSAAVRRAKLKKAKSEVAVIAAQIRGQAQLDSMLMRYPESPRKVIFKNLRPFLKFDAIYPTEENTKVVDREDFSKLREKYASD